MWLILHVAVVTVLAMGHATDVEGSINTQAGIRPRIAGGSHTKIDYFPFMAQVVVRRTDQPPAHCGGTIVSRRHILTSLRCVLDRNNHVYPPSEVAVIVGTTYKHRGGTLLEVSAIQDHRAFNKNTTEPRDLAVLTLNKYITFTNLIKPVRMAIDEDVDFIIDLIDQEETCFVLGWGNSQIRPGESSKLKMTVVQLKPLTSCNASLPAMNSNLLCAVSIDSSVLCNGDAGGPIMCDGLQAGVISQPVDADCATAGSHEWFARIDTAYSDLSAMVHTI